MSFDTVKLTTSQAMIRWLSVQKVQEENVKVPFFAGCWAIFGHGNVAALGEALYMNRKALPTYRAHNEQGMVHAAAAFAKQKRRRRAMICTTSIGPGATNMITAAAGAYVNRLPVLLIPGDVYASRRPDPVLQQAENFFDSTTSFNDAFKPVSRFFDRITRPEQIIDSLPKTMSILTDSANCGPATLSFCQDVQAEAFDYPISFFEERVWRFRRSMPDPYEIDELVKAIKTAERPLIIAGGGVLYSQAEKELSEFANKYKIPVAETQAGKGALRWDDAANLGSIGVTGTLPANNYASQSDLIIGMGSRLADFTTGSRTLFPQATLYQVNTQSFDAYKHGANPVLGDIKLVLQALEASLGSTKLIHDNVTVNRDAIKNWNHSLDSLTEPDPGKDFPSDAQVIGATQRTVGDDAIVVCAAGGLPGELHKHWRTTRSGGYHLEYGYSCMGYEISGGLGVKLAEPERDVVVMVGDGSYLMMNSEIASSIMLGAKLIITVLDNRGYGCINRLQRASGSPGFNNLLEDTAHESLPEIDFQAHAASLGAASEKVSSISEFESAMARAKSSQKTYVIVIETNPDATTDTGGWWWDVAVPEVSEISEVNEARRDYDAKIRLKRDRS